MSNALTTELWDQAEPRRRPQVFHSKGSSQHVPHILIKLGSFTLPQGTNNGQFLDPTRSERKWINFERIGRTSNSKDQLGKWTAWKEKKLPDPPGLEPGTMLVMSNALTTELWDQAEPRRRPKVFTPKAAHNTCHTYWWHLGLSPSPQGTNHGQFQDPTRSERKWLNFERIGRNSNSKDQLGKWTAWKEKKSPDPPGLQPRTLLVMSNALTTKLWDQAEPRKIVRPTDFLVDSFTFRTTRVISTTFARLNDLAAPFLTSSTWQQPRSTKKWSLDSEGSDGSEIWIWIRIRPNHHSLWFIAF